MTGRQLFRFAVVGVASNLLLYIAYLLITRMGLGHKTSMSVLYVTGVCMTFVLNRKWTFTHGGNATRAFLEYVTLYAFGYLVNFLVLYLFVDRWNFDHRVIQGLMILILAGFFFLSQKYLVFRNR